LGRWTQPDTVTPGGTQGLDRYHYAENNPVRYNDPSGHCSGDPYDPNNTDKDCWDLYNFINSFYGINVFNGSDWLYTELISLYTAVNAAYLALGNKAFGNIFGGTSFVRTSADASWVTPIEIPNFDNNLNYYGLGHTIFLSSYSMTGFDAVFNIVHELGHVFDFHSAWGDSNLYKSQRFVVKFSPWCDAGLLGCLGSAPSKVYEVWNLFGSPASQYSPGLGATDYGKRSSSIDDYADSWANAVLGIVNLSGLISTENLVSLDRINMINLDIDLAKNY
jgi:hypothetical protein